MHPPSRTAISSYTDTSSHQRIPIAVVDENERAVPLSGINPPFATHDAPWSYIPPAYLLNGSIPGAHHVSYPYVASPSESTSDAPGSASPTALQFPQIHSSPSLPSTYKAFIDDHPMINKAYDCAKERVASYPILKASTARRTNPATFECDICKATFTRSHNLGCMSRSSTIVIHTYRSNADHRDAHFRIKKHISLCGKKFGTPSGSKRHQVTCLTCKARKDSPSPAWSTFMWLPSFDPSR